MPGTFGDSQRILHDKDGYTPAASDDVEVPSETETETSETTETDGLSVEELLRVRE